MNLYNGLNREERRRMDKALAELAKPRMIMPMPPGRKHRKQAAAEAALRILGK